LSLFPTSAFDGATLDLTRVPTGSRYQRICLARHPNPLGFGKSKSRFSDPRRRIEANRFGVLYLGSSLKVCFLEAVLRDVRNGTIGQYPMQESELLQRTHAKIAVAVDLTLVDLRGDGPVRMGIPTDVLRASSQKLGRAWSLAFHEHPSQPDGIIYPSRLNGEANLAVYGRAISKLKVVNSGPLINAAGLAAILNDFQVALAP
jgi:hypothetical protein